MAPAVSAARADVTALAGINPTKVFAAFLEADSDYRVIEPVSFTGWSTLLLVERTPAEGPRVAKGLFGYNSVLKAAPEDMRPHLYGYYWYRQLPESAHEHMDAQFRQEARILDELRHEEIAPRLHDLRLDGEIPYYVMDHVPAGSARHWSRSHRPGADEVVEFARNLLTALAVVHAHDFVHRDLNAENVLVGPDGPLIADFGCARAFEAREEPAPKPPLLHWPPEYDHDYHRASVRSDLYCFGMVVHELLTGTLPRYGAPALSERTSAPAALVDVVQRCTSWAPQDRPGSAEECLALLADRR